MRILVVGAAGMVGRAMVAEGLRRGWTVLAPAREALDLLERSGVENAVGAAAADLVVNCAAFTAVDRCEAERERAFEVNGAAVGWLAGAAAAAGARLLHLSTDYVFDGRGGVPCQEADDPAPLSAYGASKLDGERRALEQPGALIVRTSGVFGSGGANFVDSIATRIRSAKGPLRVVDDQVTAPTYAPFLARALADLGESGAAGIVHYRNREPVSWFAFATAIAEQLGSAVDIVPVSSAQMPRPARRPGYSVLAVDRFEKLAGRLVERWSDGLADHLERELKEK